MSCPGGLVEVLSSRLHAGSFSFLSILTPLLRFKGPVGELEACRGSETPRWDPSPTEGE